METRVNNVCSELKVVDFPFVGARHVSIEMCGVAVVIALAALVFFFLLKFNAIA
jgi:hypothetical protein